jgi:hypothetical protein
LQEFDHNIKHVPELRLSAQSQQQNTVDMSSNNTVITNLFNTLSLSTISSSPPQPSTPDSADYNSLKSTSPEVTRLLITLHAFFPKDFLAALDLLDRQLVTRFIPNFLANDGKPHLYFVKSASAHHINPDPTSPPRNKSNSRSSFRSAAAGGRFYNPLASGVQYYEVRTHAWNCSCPAFAFASFPAFPPADTDGAGEGEHIDDLAWKWGGISLLQKDEVAPICKHLLACILAERVPVLFGQSLQEQAVGREELAAWTAGFGMSDEYTA